MKRVATHENGGHDLLAPQLNVGRSTVTCKDESREEFIVSVRLRLKRKCSPARARTKEELPRRVALVRILLEGGPVESDHLPARPGKEFDVVPSQVDGLLVLAERLGLEVAQESGKRGNGVGDRAEMDRGAVERLRLDLFDSNDAEVVPDLSRERSRGFKVSTEQLEE